jgi:hypothetical protein
MMSHVTNATIFAHTKILLNTDLTWEAAAAATLH